MRSIRVLIGSIMVALLAACASTRTELLSVETTPDAAAPYARVLVLTVADNGQIRQVVEQSLAQRLSDQGVSSQVASLLMPGGLDKSEPEQIRAAAEKVVAESGVDAVLVTVLLHEDVRQDYVPPRNDVVAVGNVPYFMGYGAYVGYHYDVVYTPGYITQEKDYFVQTKLFDVSTGEAVWRAQTRTIDPQGLADGVKSFSKAVIGRLKDDGMLGNAAP